MHLRMRYSVEYSYSFQFGDAVRECIFRPWKLLLFPLTLVRRHRKIQKHRRLSESLTDYLFLVDFEKLTPSERVQCQALFSSLTNAIVVTIGDELVENGTHQFQSFSFFNKTTSAWNNDLENFLEALVTISKPEKFIFIGQYPYSGVTSLLRKVEPVVNTAWIPAHAKDEALRERGPRFGHVLAWPESRGNMQEIREEGDIFVSTELPKTVTSLIKRLAEEIGLSLTESPFASLQLLDGKERIEQEIILEKQSVAVLIHGHEDENTQQIETPNVHAVLYSNDFILFEYQLRELMICAKERRLYTPRVSVLDEQRWVDTYSSF